MRIQELAEQTGLTAHTIRFYEKEGLLDPRHVTRERNNYRNYKDDAIEQLRLIKKLQSVGFTLMEMREILLEPEGTAPKNRLVIERLRKKIAEIQSKKDEYDHVLKMLAWMLDYRVALDEDPQRAASLLKQIPRH